MNLTVLQCGQCETLKAGVHGSALALSVLMGLYNVAAWVKRRDAHLAVNAVFYVGLAAWEHKHLAHHLRVMKRLAVGDRSAPPAEPAETPIAA